jgi:hypothetical protein
VHACLLLPVPSHFWVINCYEERDYYWIMWIPNLIWLSSPLCLVGDLCSVAHLIFYYH